MSDTNNEDTYLERLEEELSEDIDVFELFLPGLDAPCAPALFDPQVRKRFYQCIGIGVVTLVVLAAGPMNAIHQFVFG